jgi:hypothetical protein
MPIAIPMWMSMSVRMWIQSICQVRFGKQDWMGVRWNGDGDLAVHQWHSHITISWSVTSSHSPKEKREFERLENEELIEMQ